MCILLLPSRFIRLHLPLLLLRSFIILWIIWWKPCIHVFDEGNIHLHRLFCVGLPSRWWLIAWPCRGVGRASTRSLFLMKDLLWPRNGLFLQCLRKHTSKSQPKCTGEQMSTGCWHVNQHSQRTKLNSHCTPWGKTKCTGKHVLVYDHATRPRATSSPPQKPNETKTLHTTWLCFCLWSAELLERKPLGAHTLPY